MGSLRFLDAHKQDFIRHSNWFLFWGFVLAALGVAAASAAAFTTLLSVVILGFVIFSGGCIMLLDTFSFWRGKARSFFVHLLLAALYVIVGLVLINNPLEGSVSLTLLLGVFYLFAGVYRLTFNTLIKMPRWGWGFFNGIITLVLGILILSSWPESSVFIIGLFVGIDLFFVGWFYIMAALAAKSWK